MNPFIDFLLQSQFRGLSVLLAAFAIAWCIRRRSSTFRSILWRATFLALALGPIISLVAPSLPLPPLPDRVTEPFGFKEDRESYRIEILPRGSHRTEVETSATPSSSATTRSDTWATQNRIPSPPTAMPGMAREVKFSWPRLSFTDCLMGIWFIGVLFLLVRLLVAHVLRRRLRIESTTLQDETSIPLTERLLAELQISQMPNLRIHPNLTSPLSWGFRQATILLPTDALTWDKTTLRLVLRHELNHFRQRDAMFRLIAELGLIFYWPNPFAWLALTRLRLVEEQTTDDAVIDGGESPADYASLLLNFSQKNHSTPSLATSASLSMAQPSTVKIRLEALLVSKNRPLRPRRPTSVLWAAVMGAMTFGFTALTFEAHSTEPGADTASTPDNTVLQTRSLPLEPVLLSQSGEAPSRSVTELLWASRGVTPPKGATARYDSLSKQLIVRTTEKDFNDIDQAFYKKKDKATAAPTNLTIDIAVFEMAQKDADLLARGDNNEISVFSEALDQVRSQSDGERLLGTISVRAPIGRTRLGSFSGPQKHANSPLPIKARTLLNATDSDTRFQLIFDITFGNEAPVTGTPTDLTPMKPRLIGVIPTGEGDRAAAIFATLHEL